MTCEDPGDIPARAKTILLPTGEDAGGRTKALFILDIRQQREIVELAQRMDLDVRTVRIASVFENISYGLLEDFATGRVHGS